MGHFPYQKNVKDNMYDLNDPIYHANFKADVSEVSFFQIEQVIKDTIVAVEVLEVLFNHRNIIAKFISIFGCQCHVEVNNALNVTARNCRISRTI